MDKIFSWLFHRSVNYSVEDIDQNLFRHMKGLSKISQMRGLFLKMICVEDITGKK